MKPITHAPAVRVAILAYDGVQGLDLCGPHDAFDSANAIKPGAYEALVVTLDGLPFRSEAGLRLAPDRTLADAGPLDTLILPGGAGLRRPGVAEAVSQAIKALAPNLRRVVCVCTGIYGLAPSGLLDRRRATTHWRFAADVAARFPHIRLEPDAIYIKDGPLYTSAGITAAVDVTLALIEEDHGPALALATARDLVVYLKRFGGQRQYSEPLRFQARAGDRFAELAAWMAANLDQDLGVEALAARAGLSPRQFNRRFAAVFGCTPAHKAEALRLDAARDLLTGSDADMSRIAHAVGFKSADAFRRAFNRVFGLPPGDYRRRFAAHEQGTAHVQA